jgi:hypothetical protein
MMGDCLPSNQCCDGNNYPTVATRLNNLASTLRIARTLQRGRTALWAIARDFDRKAWSETPQHPTRARKPCYFLRRHGSPVQAARALRQSCGIFGEGDSEALTSQFALRQLGEGVRV